MLKDLKNKGIPIELDRTRYINFSFNTLVELEEKYGSIENFEKKVANPSLKDMRYILYVSLKEDDETLTEKKVGSLITIENINYVLTAITNSLYSSLLPEDIEDIKDDEEKN